MAKPALEKPYIAPKPEWRRIALDFKITHPRQRTHEESIEEFRAWLSGFHCTRRTAELLRDVLGKLEAARPETKFSLGGGDP
jgi:hypothetical protein